MDIAERYGEDFLRVLVSAECFKDAAISPGSDDSKILLSRSSALLVSVTFADHFFGDLPAFFRVVFFVAMILL
jgi:hypothetical protein